MSNFEPPDDDVAFAELDDTPIQPVYPAVPAPPQSAFTDVQPPPARTVSLQRSPATQVQIASPGRLLLVALGLGIAVDILFYGKMLGISVPVLTVLLLGALFALGRLEDAPPIMRNLWLVVPTLFFAAMVSVRANVFLSVLNVFAVLVLLAMLTYFYAEGRVERLGLLGYVAVPAIGWAQSLVQAGVVLAGSRAQVPNGVPLRSSVVSGGRLRYVLPVLRGLVIALPILAVFTLLLSSADTVFANLVGNILKIDLSSLPDLTVQAIIVVAAAWVAAGGLAFSLRRRVRPVPENESLPAALPPARIMGAVEAATVLLLVDLLFFAFVVVQFLYLFAGRTMTTLEDSSYKQYARRGFGELIFVSVLTIGLILLMRWLVRHDTPGQERLFNILSTVMVGLSLVILASAWSRMFYWEEVSDYIATGLRLYVRIFIIWLALTFGWLVVSLWWRPAQFALGAFVAAMGFLATLNLVNPDDDVVRYNVARAAQRELYVPYLSGLSEDAVPALVQALDTVPESQRPELRASLAERLRDMEQDKSWQTWQSFHLSRQRAYEVLAQNRDKLR